MHFYENVIFGLQTAFLDGFNVLMSFLAENDAEWSRNFFKKQILNPTHAKMNQHFDFCMQFPYSFLGPKRDLLWKRKGVIPGERKERYMAR